ncbi:hypothetical protein D3C81_1148430 [compost metagenome]
MEISRVAIGFNKVCTIDGLFYFSGRNTQSRHHLLIHENLVFFVLTADNPHFTDPGHLGKKWLNGV